MDEAHKEKLRVARAAARARKTAVDAEEVEHPNYVDAVKQGLAPTDTPPSEVDALKAELAALKEKHREKAPHEREPFREERINDRRVSGVQDEIKESLRELLREQLAETFPERDIRKPVRDEVRPGAVVAYDREGNPLFRKRDTTRDRFAIPEDLKENGYDYQWCRVSTYGQEDLNNQVAHQENGWRFVQADRPGWNGRFMPEGYKGHIFQDGLALMERPMVLTEEAKREAERAVKEQSRAQREQFGMALPEGFTANNPTAKAFTFARAGKAEATPSNLKPSHRVDSNLDIE